MSLKVISTIKSGSAFSNETGSRLDPVSLENADPDLIVLITFKLTVGVCQNIRCNVQSVVACGRIRIWISKFKRFRTQISACRIQIGSEFFNM